MENTLGYVSAKRPRETLWGICGTFPIGVAGRVRGLRKAGRSVTVLACPSLPHLFWKRGQTGRLSLEKKVSRHEATLVPLGKDPPNLNLRATVSASPMHWRRKWQATPVFGESQGRRSCSLSGRTVGHD